MLSSRALKWLVEEELGQDLEDNFSEEELKAAQRIVGEQLWLAMRTRPDVLYVTNPMSSRVSKQPLEVIRIGRRVLAYLQSTSSLGFKIHGQGSSSSSTPCSLLARSSRNGTNLTSSSSSTPGSPIARSSRSGTNLTSSPSSSATKAPARNDEDQTTSVSASPELIGYSDASYAPYGGRSFGAAVITVDGFPVSWKAGKQSFVTMSVMEAELYEASQASILLEHVGVLLNEISGKHVP